MTKTKVLVTGACGQIGQVLTQELRKIHGNDNVLATDIRKDIIDQDPYEFLDILNRHRLKELLEDYKITEIYHLAAILSASGEDNPLKTWEINLNGLLSVLDVSKSLKIKKVLFPSTIAVFGNTTPKINTPQEVPLLPSTVYGISKTTGELWCNYYFDKFKLDVRCLRYPGVIGYQSIPSGGTTDYAVEIFHKALKNESYTCFLKEDTLLPMMYIHDAIRGTIELMQAPKEKIKLRHGYNLAAISFSPSDVVTAIKKSIPDFKINFKPDFRQEIAESWSKSIDDSCARNDWGWSHEYDLDKIAHDMLEKLKPLYV